MRESETRPPSRPGLLARLLRASRRRRATAGLVVSCALLSVLPLAAARPAKAGARSEAPVPAATLALMRAKGVAPDAPILMRAYKKESEIEVWKRNAEGRYVHLKTFPICRWSGALGPKRREGDRQTVEGFYSVAARQMNPNSAYYLSFDTGYPNAYDRAHGGSGSALMVHGTCSSAGCFAMTDKGVAELYALARDALRGGQAAFQFQAFPFHMSAQNMARYRADPNIGFWRQLKEGSDRFEATGEPPEPLVLGGRYAFAPYPDAEKEALALARRLRETMRISKYVALGSASVRTTYVDGGQHPSFTAQLARGADLGMVSRPEALAYAGFDEVLSPARGLCARKGGCPETIMAGPSPARAKPAAGDVLAAAADLAPNADMTPAAEMAPEPAGEATPPDAAASRAAGRITFAAARVVALRQPEPTTLRPTRLSYELQLKTPPQTLIAGAMPILPDAWF